MNEDARALNVAQDVWRSVVNAPDDLSNVVQGIPDRPTKEPSFVVLTKLGEFEIFVSEVPNKGEFGLVETFFESGDHVTIKVQISDSEWVNCFQGGWGAEGKEFFDTLVKALGYAQKHPRRDVLK